MSPLDLIASVILVTTSGALAPGPVVFATIVEGSRHGAKAGLIFTMGHAIVELPLVLLLTLGFVSFSQPAVKVVVGILGGIALLFFGLQQVKEASRPLSSQRVPGERGREGLLVKGVVINALNPFFIIWWLSVGAMLILDTLPYGIIGVLTIMYIPHVLIDLVWLVLLAYSAMRGRSLLGSRGYRLMLGLFGIFLVLFGLNFIFVALEVLASPG
jgi:threonine/homoserine/homoserine lactone efflux protein